MCLCVCSQAFWALHKIALIRTAWFGLQRRKDKRGDEDPGQSVDLPSVAGFSSPLFLCTSHPKRLIATQNFKIESSNLQTKKNACWRWFTLFTPFTLTGNIKHFQRSLNLMDNYNSPNLMHHLQASIHVLNLPRCTSPWRPLVLFPVCSLSLRWVLLQPCDGTLSVLPSSSSKTSVVYLLQTLDGDTPHIRASFFFPYFWELSKDSLNSGDENQADVGRQWNISEVD